MEGEKSRVVAKGVARESTPSADLVAYQSRSRHKGAATALDIGKNHWADL